MEERKEMDFGKKYRAGNFQCYKTTRSLSKREVAGLRNAVNMPPDVRKHLNRGGLPYITVQTIGGGWSISFVCGSTMYRFIEYEITNGESGIHALGNLFTMMYSDTTILGDSQYSNDKAVAIKAFMERQKAVCVSDEENDKELETLKAEEEAKAAIVDMAKEIEARESGREGGAHEEE